jgi:hypothetical protein
MSSPDRPTPRTRPRPARDEGVDPVVAPAGAGYEGARGGRRVGPEQTVQLNVRVAVEISELIAAEVGTSGRTKRDLIEQAVRSMLR